MCSVQGFLPIGECLPIENSRLITLDFDTARAGFKPGLAPEFHGAADVESVPLSMLRYIDHVADDLGGGQPRDQPIFCDLECEILAPFIRVQPRFAVRPFFAGLVGHYIVFAADTIRQWVVLDRRSVWLVARR
ncbi:hypothetical protein BROWWM01_80370 [Bradyrhizobium ottawaense]